MENVDKAMESRVWQRVQARQEPQMPPLQRDNLKPWILAAQENAGVMRNLSLQLIGKQWEGLRRLELDSSRMVQSLRGICALRGENVKLTPLPTPREAPRRALEKSFHRCCRLREAMESRCDDAEFGSVFRALTRRAEDQCAALAELIGRLEV